MCAPSSLSAGVAAAIAILKQFGLRSLAAAKAAYAVIRGSDHVERRMQQEAAWEPGAVQCLTAMQTIAEYCGERFHDRLTDFHTANAIK